VLPVSAELAAAILAPERAARVRLSVDWRGDGHDGKGTIDDLSHRVASLTVGAVLQGTLPDQVNVVEGIGAATLTADLTRGASDDDRSQAPAYFSVFNTGSPLFGLPRLARDVQVDIEYHTPSGWQGVPVLRGLSRGLPVTVAQGTAQLQAIDYRARLRNMVSLPVCCASAKLGLTNLTRPGLESTWVASYVLYQCGLPVSPPPPVGTRVWAPMHGSAIPFIGAPIGSPFAWSGTFTAGAGTNDPVLFDTGPFLLGTKRGQLTHASPEPTPAGTAMFDANGHSAGRIQMWVKTDGAENVPFVVQCTNSYYASPTLVSAGLAAPFHVLGLILQNGVNSVNPTGPTIPVDGGWHQIGVEWSDAAGTVTWCLDGQLTTGSFTPTPASTGAVDVWQAVITATAPVAEVIVSTGLPTTTPWQPLTYTPPVALTRLAGRLDGIVVQPPAQAWTILQELLTAEQGSVYFDATGTLQIAPRRVLLTAAAQTVQRTVDGTRDMFDLAYDFTLDKIYNQVKGAYQAIDVASAGIGWSLTDLIILPAGQQITLTIACPDMASRNRVLIGLANTASDGSGTSYVIGAAPNTTSNVTYPAAGIAAVVVTNTSAGTLYLVDTTGTPALSLIGDVVTQGAGSTPAVLSDPASIALYGPLPFDLPTNQWVQQQAMAAGLAMAILPDLAWPQPVFPAIPMAGDPRLQPFDRVHLQDPTSTAVAADVWVVGQTHTLDGTGNHVGQLVCRPARNRFLAGSGLVGQDLVG
jgi:hypothetical protein